jgi:hypothetical protein
VVFSKLGQGNKGHGDFLRAQYSSILLPHALFLLYNTDHAVVLGPRHGLQGNHPNLLQPNSPLVIVNFFFLSRLTGSFI